MLFAPRRRAGFTLVEMVAVIAVIGTLAGFVLATLPGIVGRSERAKCMNNLQQIGKAMEVYSSDHYGCYPRLNGSIVVDDVADKPWHFELQRYGIEAKALCCPCDHGFDPTQYPDPTSAVERLVYRSHNMSYGMQYDWRDGNGSSYRALRTGGWEGSEPDGTPDLLRLGDWRKRSETVWFADSDGDGSEDYAIDLTGLHPIGGRHDGWANVLFGDLHVAPRQVMPEKGLDINAEYRHWTLAND